MTIEQNRRCAISYLNELKASTSGYSVEWLDMAIKVLEQQPCENCVSRQAVKEMLREEWTKYIPMELDINLSYVLEKISKLPTVTPQQTRWIPVSERLPEERIAVLVWCPERKNIYCACYEEKQWWIFGAYFKKIELDVIAWMPLPEPYRESEDEV